MTTEQLSPPHLPPPPHLPLLQPVSLHSFTSSCSRCPSTAPSSSTASPPPQHPRRRRKRRSRVLSSSSEDEEEQLMEEAGFQEYQDDVDSLEGRPAPEPAVPQKDDPLPEAEQVNDPLAFLRQLCGSQPQSNMTTDMFHLPSMDYIPDFCLQAGSDELVKKTSLPAAGDPVLPTKGGSRGDEPGYRLDPGCRRGHRGRQAGAQSAQHPVWEVQGQTFHWLLSNDMEYTTMIVAGHQDERESGDTTTSPAMLNKNSLSRYVRLFPRVMSVIQQRRMADGSLSASSFGDQDDRLVGFAKHTKLTYQEFYEPADSIVQSYRMWLRKNRVSLWARRWTA
ncbi:uncharacterized protein LOC115566029 [Sparus aurata]|uniref:uncharacterized protein LOC115566029 n=1 Tax=Sparus aurata TaxID=8175 RepID=UPI0011C0C9C4|nr:uncharacterized protein LOC115566029 [Sparus aurata]